MEQHRPQQITNNQTHRNVRSGLFLIVVILLSSTITYMFMKKEQPKDVYVSKVRTVQFLVHDGAVTKTWANVTLEEGESVADTLDRIGRVDGLTITWAGNGKERKLIGVNESMGGEWKYYINGASPLPSIGKYFPKDKDIIAIIKQT